MLKVFRTKLFLKLWQPWTQKAKISSEKNTFQSLNFFMIYSQILGLLPQENITKDVKQMHFKWLSWHTTYSLFFTIVSGIAFGCSLLYRVQYSSEGISSVSTNVFLLGGFAMMVITIRLAMNWSNFMNIWYGVDKVMNASYGYPDNLDFKIRMASCIYVCLGIADFSLSITNQTQNLQRDLGENYSVQAYYNHTAKFIFAYIPYHPVVAATYSIMTAQATLGWALIDLYVIVLSTALAARFKQINTKLENERKDNITENEFRILLKDDSITFWRTIREDYDRLACLCNELDNQISTTVLLSYFLNIFFLLVQLYHSLSYMGLIINKVYFVFSFLYLIFKTVCVSLYAAAINDESKAPSSILNSVDSSVYNIEIKRLLTQISFDKTALTGCKMFTIKRGLILSVASAIVTYELVLIQFNNADLYETK